jgi:hypothetical protein
MCETWSQHIWCLFRARGFGPLKPGCDKEHLGMSTICLGMSLGLPHLEMAGWGYIYSPQHKTSRWRKAATFCVALDRPVGSPNRPVRLAVGSVSVGDRWRACFLHRTVRWSYLHGATWN